MNIWRNNRYNIQAQVNKILTTTSLPISIKFSDLPCEDSPKKKKQLENKSVSNFHYSLFTEPDNIVAAKHGNVSYLHSTDVLRKVKSQHMSKSRFDSDMWQDILSTQLSFKSTIRGDKINGYIQTISHTPFVIHLYSEEQILLLKHLQKQNLTFHLDATSFKITYYTMRYLFNIRNPV